MPRTWVPVVITLCVIIACLFILTSLNALTLWTFLLVVFGGLYVISFIVDRFHKKHNLKPDYNKRARSKTNTKEIDQDNHTEQMKHINGPRGML
ncbi:hypothetical protein [Piscibacillus salipiscarius]|uniref:Uncharacterized protein n=1 Tax=Piscibacillus salipiscarius TaxID=299480 RepID=A0ABW5QDD5_9BACI|nr:hypothetical protein [Piscibacillus salipiscarius]